MAFTLKMKIIETDRPINHCSQRVLEQSNINDAIQRQR